MWGKLRVAGLASGSGNTLWKVLDLQRELERTWEGSPFEVVALFSDSPDAKCVATAAEYGIPCESVGIRAFYEKRGAPLKDREVDSAPFRPPKGVRPGRQEMGRHGIYNLPHPASRLGVFVNPSEDFQEILGEAVLKFRSQVDF